MAGLASGLLAVDGISRLLASDHRLELRMPSSNFRAALGKLAVDLREQQVEPFDRDALPID